MSSMTTLFVLVPVLNEIGNIARLMNSLKALSVELKDQHDVEVILIDDGSRDGTGDLAQRLAKESSQKLSVLRHEVNQGPGKAFATGFQYLTPLLGENDIVLTIEGDNTSRIELVKQMLTRLQEGFDVIFASPYMYGGGIINTSAYRIFLSSMANLFVKELLGLQGILTVSSFFRLYRSSALIKMQNIYGTKIIERRGFECMVEMVMKMVNLGITISEVPLVLDTKARVGRSRMNVMKTIVGYLGLWSLKRRWLTQASQGGMNRV
jgi:dolichol-phosphate mannosyltransferase